MTEFKRKPDRTLNTVNLAGLIAAALLAAMLAFFWTHPGYVPACIAGYRSSCAYAFIPPAPPLSPPAAR